MALEVQTARTPLFSASDTLKKKKQKHCFFSSINQALQLK